MFQIIKRALILSKNLDLSFQKFNLDVNTIRFPWNNHFYLFLFYSLLANFLKHFFRIKPQLDFKWVLFFFAPGVIYGATGP